MIMHIMVNNKEMRVCEAAEYFGVSRRTMYTWIERLKQENKNNRGKFMGRKKEYLTLGQVAAIIGVTRQTLYKWMKENKLSYINHQTSNRRMISKSEVQRLMKIEQFSKDE